MKLIKILLFNVFSPLPLPALSTLPVNSIIFTILPVNLKPGKKLNPSWYVPLELSQQLFG
jgi:hypothetical protein